MPSTVGRIVIRDGRLRRTVPVDASVGTIEIDLADEEHTVVLPPDVAVERRD